MKTSQTPATARHARHSQGSANRRQNILRITRYHLLGIILLAAAPIAYLLQQRISANVILFALAGLTLTFTPARTGLPHWRAFAASLTRAPGRTLRILAYDLVFWLLLVITSIALGSYLQNRVRALGLVDLQDQALLNPQIVADNIGIVSSFFTQSIIAILFTLTLLTFAHATLNTFAWQLLVGKTFSWTTVKKYLAASALLFTSWTIAAVILLAVLKPEVIQYALPVFIVVVAHGSLLITAHTARQPHAAAGIADGLLHAIRLPSFIVPYAYIIFTYLLFMIIVTLTTAYPTVLLVASGVSFILFTAWIKVYIHELITLKNT